MSGTLLPEQKPNGLGIAASLVIIVIIRFITAVLTMGCGVPCGVFIPMLAIDTHKITYHNTNYRGD